MPGCGSPGVTVVVAGATWLVSLVSGGRGWIQTAVGIVSGRGGPMHEPLAGSGGMEASQARATVTGRQDRCGAAVRGRRRASDSSGPL